MGCPNKKPLRGAGEVPSPSAPICRVSRPAGVTTLPEAGRLVRRYRARSLRRVWMGFSRVGIESWGLRCQPRGWGSACVEAKVLLKRQETTEEDEELG